MVQSSPRPRDEYSRLLFEEATDGIFVCSADGVYLEVNRSGHRMLGYDPGELIGMHISKLVIERDLVRQRAAMAGINAGEQHTQIWSLVRKDGSVVQIELQAQRLNNGAILGVARDLHGRAEFERKVQASEAALWSILHTAPDTIMTVNRQGRILFINRVRPPFTAEQVVGSSCFDYVPPESRERVERAIEHVFTTRTIDEYEVQGPPDLEGHRVWASVRAGPLIERDQVVAATLCATDVTERKREAARSRELLERLGQIASLVPGVLYQYQLHPDGSSCFPYASERLYDVFRVRPEDVRQNADRVLSAIHPADGASTRSSIEESARTLAAWHHEFRVALANGEVRWLLGEALPRRESDGSTLWHGLITDVTDRKQAERARARLEEQLLRSQKMESVGQLAGGVAHDFNNLLTAVVAFVELTQEELPRGAKAQEYLEAIQAAAARGASLTQQLLAFARKKIVTPEDANLNEIVARMAPMIRRLVGEHIEVELAFAPELNAVQVDVGSMEQVVMNLIVNARDAMPQGGRLTLETHAITLDASCEQTHPDMEPGDYVQLSVTDTGTGITPEVRAHLFEPFFTTKPPGSGTGLGLAMCHGIVKQAGGTIHVYSEAGNGSSFRIYLPARGSLRPAAPEPPRITRRAGKETLLVVEDEPLILRVAQAALEKLGYHVLCAHNGQHALEVASKTAEPIDLLITDVVMPKLGGRELATRLQAMRPTTRVLYTSGYAEKAIAHHGVLREGVDLIQKPYALATLTRRVREALDRK
ncbi:MAG TPA: PAS domain S-box protein [Polyangiales bacterium]|nr:PAS domain S-box protein [Polyangiales bacterium]